MAKARVLLIDDEPSVLLLLEAAFEPRQWNIVKAATGEEGLAEVKRALPDVMLVDKNLPGISGVEVIREVRRMNEELGIIMMTGYASPESATETLNLGIDEYVVKPFDDVLLLAGLVERVIARARNRAHEAGARRHERPLSILVASADEARRPRIVAALPKRDKPSFAGHTDEVLTALTVDRPDLLVLDGASYRAEATTLVGSVRQKFPDLSIVALSKRLTLSDIQRLIQLRIAGLVDHPIESPQFNQTLSAAVERVRRRAR